MKRKGLDPVLYFCAEKCPNQPVQLCTTEPSSTCVLCSLNQVQKLVEPNETSHVHNFLILMVDGGGGGASQLPLKLLYLCGYG